MGKTLLISVLFFLGSLHGETRGEPGCFAVSAEWLFVTAAIDQPYYVINSSSNLVTNGERFSNHQSWHQGYRVEALYRFCNRLNDVSIRWTHIPRFIDQNTVSGANLYGVFTSAQRPLAGSRGQASIRDDFNVFSLDLLLGQTLFDFCHFHFAFQGGFQYGYASLFEETSFHTNQVGGVQPRIVRNRSKISGAGPELGIHFSYRFYKWLGILGRASGALLIAHREASLFDNGTLVSTARLATQVKNSTYWVVIPTSDLRLGLTFRNPFDFRRWFDCSPVAALGCLNIDLEIGYEVISFYKAFDRIFFSDDTDPGTSFDNLIDLTFHGPYIHLGLSF